MPDSTFLDTSSLFFLPTMSYHRNTVLLALWTESMLSSSYTALIWILSSGRSVILDENLALYNVARNASISERKVIRIDIFQEGIADNDKDMMINHRVDKYGVDAGCWSSRRRGERQWCKDFESGTSWKLYGSYPSNYCCRSWKEKDLSPKLSNLSRSFMLLKKIWEIACDNIAVILLE